MSIVAEALPKIGLDFESIDVQIYLRGQTSVAATSAVVVGDVLCFCAADVSEITASSTYDSLCSTATAVPGARNSIWANATKNYTSVHVGSQLYCVALEKGTVGTSLNPRPLLRVRVRGLVKANVQAADNTTSVSIGSDLFISNPAGGGNKPGYLDASASKTPTSTVTRRKVALALEAYTGTPPGTTSVGTIMQVYFDGLNGISAANQT